MVDALRNLVAGWRVQIRCLHALIIRELMVRYGRDNIGFLWVVLEPMLLTAAVMIVWSTVRPFNSHGVQVLSFVLTGYMPLTLWRHITNAGIYVLRRSRDLFYHQNISMLDAFFSRVILEFAGTTAALVIVYATIYLAGLVSPIEDFGLVAWAWLTMGMFATSVALVFAVLTEWSETAERFIQPIQYITLPISGVFFLVDWLPSYAQNIVWYVPMVHCYEMFRAGFLGEGIPTYYSPWYVWLWTLTLTSVGLVSFEKIRDRVHFS